MKTWENNVCVWNFTSNSEKCYWNVGNASTSLRRQMYEPNAVFWVVQSFQNRRNVDWWKTPKWTIFRVNRQRSHRSVRDLILQIAVLLSKGFLKSRGSPEALREAVGRKRSQLLQNQRWVLHHDNAPTHSSLLVRNFLAKNETTVVPQPTYITDLAPAEF